MSRVIMTIVLSPTGEIRINNGNSARTFANATYVAEELAQHMVTQVEYAQKERAIREELNRAEKVDGTLVDLVANVRKVLDEGVPF